MAVTSDPEAPAHYRRQRLERLLRPDDLKQSHRRRVPALAVAAVAALLLAACGVGGLSSFPALAAVVPLQGWLDGARYQAVVAVHQPPLAADGLQVATADGQPVEPDIWISRADLRLVAALHSPEQGARLQLEVEFRPA